MPAGPFLIFFALIFLLASAFGFLFLKLHLVAGGNIFTPRQQFFSELFQVLALVSAAAIMAVIERRSILDYNLRGARRVTHFFSGLAVGFAALSALVGLSGFGALAALRPGCAQWIAKSLKFAGDLGCGVSPGWLL